MIRTPKPSFIRPYSPTNRVLKRRSRLLLSVRARVRIERLDMEELLRIGQQALDAQPFSSMLGTRLASFSEEGAVLEIPIREELLQQNGFVHGGVLSYAADNALTFAGGSALGPAVLTSEYKINYLRPASGRKLIARASVVYAGKRQAVCRCDVLSVAEGGEEKLCATAQGTIVSTASDGQQG